VPLQVLRPPYLLRDSADDRYLTNQVQLELSGTWWKMFWKSMSVASWCWTGLRASNELQVTSQGSVTRGALLRTV